MSETTTPDVEGQTAEPGKPQPLFADFELLLTFDGRQLEQVKLRPVTVIAFEAHFGLPYHVVSTDFRFTYPAWLAWHHFHAVLKAPGHEEPFEAWISKVDQVVLLGGKDQTEAPSPS